MLLSFRVLFKLDILSFTCYYGIRASNQVLYEVRGEDLCKTSNGYETSTDRLG